MADSCLKTQLLWGIPCPEGLFENDQLKLISFIKESIEDDRLSTSECLRDLVMKVTGNPEERLPELPPLEWTTQMIDVLRELIVRGADPTWTPEGCRASALFTFFRVVFSILSQIIEPQAIELEELLSFFLTEKCIKHRESQGTLLHALLSNQSLNCIANDDDLCMKFKEMASIFASLENIDAIDNEGKTPLHLLAKGLSKCDKETLPHFWPLEMFDLLKTPENMNMKDSDGRTPLHLLAKGLSKCDKETLSHLWLLDMFDLLRTPENMNMKDSDGRTPLHLLAKRLFEDEVKISKPLSLLSLLLTPQNVICEDNYFMTPYSWILVGKGKCKDDSSMQEQFAEIEQEFINKGADAKIVLLRWMEKEFGDGDGYGWRTSEKRLERLLGCMEAIANWEHHNYRLHLNGNAIKNLLEMKNSRWMDIVMKIMRVISKNKTTAQHIWDAVMDFYVRYIDRHIPLHIMEMLSICAEAGAQSTDKQLDGILKHVKVYTRNGEWAEPYLNILSSYKEKHGLYKYDLAFLGEFYQVPPKLVRLAKELVHLKYNSWDECVASEQLINCFLFITNEQEMLNDEVIEASTCDNWMKRGPLHLAVIFLDSLKFLSHGMIEKYIEEKDVHGCTPLHLAHLHNNNHAMKFLMGYMRDDNCTDHFGLTPRNMQSSIGDIIEEKYFEDCCKVLEAKEKVMELLKPMVVMLVDEAETLLKELMILFERLIRETKFKEAKIQIAGSMRERMKSGILDDADIQILLDRKMVGPLEDEDEQRNFMKELSSALTGALSNISWEGVHLRPTDVSGPWKVIWEGSGRGMQISLDVVLILIGDGMNEKNTEHYYKIIQGQQEIIQGAPRHKAMEFMTLEPWKERKQIDKTLFGIEWDIIDSLPMPCRLSSVISQAFVGAYDCVIGYNSLGGKMLITSYYIKTALFYLHAHNESSQYRDLDLKDALDKVKGKRPRTEKLQFNPNARWVNAEDLQEHREEARVWAQCIFLLIKRLAVKRRKLSSYWERRCDLLDNGQAEYVLALCDCALEKLMGKDPFNHPEKPGRPDLKLEGKAVTLTWKKPLEDGGSPITNYVIETKSNNKVDWTVVKQSKKVTKLTYTLSDLMCNTDYEFRVSAQNKAGVGAPSSPSSTVRYECKIIEASGGEIDLPKVSLLISASSLKEPVPISVTQMYPEKQLQERIDSAGLNHVFEPVVQLCLQPHGQQFLKPVKLLVKNVKLSGEDILLVYHKEFDEKGETLWTDFTTRCSPKVAEDGVFLSVDHFSEYILTHVFYPVVDTISIPVKKFIHNYVGSFLNSQCDLCNFSLYYNESEQFLSMVIVTQNRDCTDFIGNELIEPDYKLVGKGCSNCELVENDSLACYYDLEKKDAAVEFHLKWAQCSSKGFRVNVPKPESTIAELPRTINIWREFRFSKYNRKICTVKITFSPH